MPYAEVPHLYGGVARAWRPRRSTSSVRASGDSGRRVLNRCRVRDAWAPAVCRASHNNIHTLARARGTGRPSLLPGETRECQHTRTHAAAGCLNGRAAIAVSRQSAKKRCPVRTQIHTHKHTPVRLRTGRLLGRFSFFLRFVCNNYRYGNL